MLLAMLGPQQPGAQNGSGGWAGMLPFLILWGVIIYFMLIRPQQQRTRKQADLMKTLKRGDRILIHGGLLATVVSVSEHSVTVRSAESKLEFQKSAVAEILESSAGAES